MTQLTVKIDVPADLVRALGSDMATAINRGALLIAAQIKREVAKYPPLSEANMPRGFNTAYSIATRKSANRWYERGYGPRWARKDGSIGGSKRSEMLNRSWAIGGQHLGAVLGSKASYAPAVHHYAEQASFHKRRGWVTDKQAVDRVRASGKMDRIMQQVVKRILKG